MKVKYFPQNTNQTKVIWSSNNDTVAKINPNGYITTSGIGSTIITAKSSENQNKKCNFYIKVTAEQGLLSSSLLNRYKIQDGDNLMIVAHPDDEMLWGGGNIIMDIENSETYFVVCLTNGSSASRANDFDHAMNEVGAKHLILTYPDLYCRHQVNWDAYAPYIQKDIHALLNYRKWKKIVTHNPDGEYGHQHHKKLVNLYHQKLKKKYNNLINYTILKNFIPRSHFQMKLYQTLYQIIY